MEDITIINKQSSEFKILLEQMNVGFLCLKAEQNSIGTIEFLIQRTNSLFNSLIISETSNIRNQNIKNIIPKEEFYWFDIMHDIYENKTPKEFEGYNSKGTQYFQIKGYISDEDEVTLLVYDWTHRIKYEEDLKERNEEIHAQNEEFRALNEELVESYETLTKANNKLTIKDKELVESNKMMQLVLDHIPARVFWKDLNSKYLGCNKNFAIDAGHEINHEVIGKNDLQLFARSIGKLYRNDDKAVMDSGIPKLNYEEPQGQEGQEERFLRTNKIPLMDEFNNIIGVLGTYEDITELKKTQKELILAKEKAEESDRLKSAFLANMSHEIRTPMNGIVGFAQLLNDQGIAVDERKHFTHIINESCQQLLRIVNDIIDVSKIESGLIEISKEEVDLLKMVEDVISFYEPMAQQKNIKLKYGCSLENCLHWVDPTKLRQIMDNLIGNAMKFTHEGSIKISISESVSIIKISVCDTGIGISEKFHKTIFDRFSQAEKSDDTKYRGTGLGLSICKGFIDKMGGKMTLESKLNIGSCFHVELP